MGSLSFRSGCFLLALGVVASACGGGHDDLTKKLASVQTELGQLQKHNERLEERLQALEVRKEAPIPRTAGAEPAGTSERPRLMVVKLEPGNEGASDPAPSDAPTATMRPEDSAADTSPRPMIRLYGSGEGSNRKRSGN